MRLKGEREGRDFDIEECDGDGFFFLSSSTEYRLVFLKLCWNSGLGFAWLFTFEEAGMVVGQYSVSI